MHSSNFSIAICIYVRVLCIRAAVSSFANLHLKSPFILTFLSVVTFHSMPREPFALCRGSV